MVCIVYIKEARRGEDQDRSRSPLPVLQTYSLLAAASKNCSLLLGAMLEIRVNDLLSTVSHGSCCREEAGSLSLSRRLGDGTLPRPAGYTAVILS